MIYLKLFENFNQNENNTSAIDFNTFPQSIRKTLEDEYGHYYRHNYDWNTKQDEFIDNPQGFKQWDRNNSSEEFIKNLDILINKTRSDLISLKRRELSKKALDYFEELIVPTLGNSVLVPALSVYMEYALYNNHSISELNKAFQDAKNIIDSDGSINKDKTTPSSIFKGDDISLVNFERFANENPEYKGVFNDWKKLFDADMKLFLKELNAYRSSTPYDKIKELYDFLVKYKG